MRVRMGTIEVDGEFRRRLNIYMGLTGLATRAEVKSWRENNGTSLDCDIEHETEEEWFAEQSGE